MFFFKTSYLLLNSLDLLPFHFPYKYQQFFRHALFSCPVILDVKYLTQLTAINLQTIRIFRLLRSSLLISLMQRLISKQPVNMG